MIGDRSELHEAFVEAYPAYVARTLESMGIAVDEVVADAIVEGAAVLDGMLTSLDRLDPIDQRHSPLELFREALRPVDRALGMAGIPPPGPAHGLGSPWDRVTWDRYGLAPGSSQVLGHRAHEAHLRWGLAKAVALAPMVNRPYARIVASGDRLDALGSAVTELGYRTSSPDDGPPSVAIIDASVPGGHDAIRRAVGEGAHVVVFGDAIDDLEIAGLRALGVALVVTTSALLRDPQAHLPAIA
ncbi:MAG: hypothetical protein R6W79_09930 [Acidimicrobiia bacterium]